MSNEMEEAVLEEEGRENFMKGFETGKIDN